MGTHEKSCHGHETKAEHAELDADAVAMCPVMIGTTVVKAEAEEDDLVREHNGQRYYLCCDSCAVLWDEAPEKYVA